MWGPEYGDETNYLRVHLAHIRRKLEPDPSQPRYFLTEPGMGYRFEAGEPDEGRDPDDLRNSDPNDLRTRSAAATMVVRCSPRPSS